MNIGAEQPASVIDSVTAAPRVTGGSYWRLLLATVLVSTVSGSSLAGSRDCRRRQLLHFPCCEVRGACEPGWPDRVAAPVPVRLALASVSGYGYECQPQEQQVAHLPLLLAR